jgi:ribosomal protein S18 acetylase RimI-like enzyme
MHNIRNVTSSDYDVIISNLNDWWGGINMTDMLPRLFFNHFQNTSYVATDGDKLVGFLIGFISPTKPTIGYIHFVGIDPSYRKNGIAKCLYSEFFKAANQIGATEYECVTSPKNHQSIQFHLKMGFKVKEGNDANENHISFFKNYDGPNEDRVLFYK